MRLEDKLAQLFFLGSDTAEPEAELEPFFRTGLGGFLLFRHHAQPYPCPHSFKEGLTRLKSRFSRAGGLSFIGIDQEGGQIERLPHWLFPTGINPVVYGLKGEVSFCEAVNREVAARMRWLGITLNFTPTVDLNRERQNPVIGQRAYGQSVAQVLPYARAVMEAHHASGVVPVAKHFPGHGSGSVDSHLDLPVFEAWQSDELDPYQALIEAGLPAVLIAHGLYPKLYKDLSGPMVPSTLSYPVVTELLRNQLGFQGVVLTDDMTMGAISERLDPVESALAALEAGCDMLVYRRAQPEAIAVYTALLKRIQSGRLSESRIDESVQRIQALKRRFDAIPEPVYTDEAMTTQAIEALSFTWAQRAMVERRHQFVSPLPFHEGTRWGVVYPERQKMVHYAPDVLQGPDLSQWFGRFGLTPRFEVAYHPQDPNLADIAVEAIGDIDVLVFVAFNSHLYPGQQALYKKLQAQMGGKKVILASLAMTLDADVLPEPWVHVQLPSYRPQAMRAFAQWLVTPPERFG